MLLRVSENAPEWRLPFLYKGDMSSYRRLMRDDYRTSRVPFDTLPALDALIATGKAADATQMAALFEGNPQLAEDVYLQFARREKNIEKAMRRHRELLEKSLRTLSGNSRVTAAGMPSFLGELRTYYRSNRYAFRRLLDEQYRLSALTGDTSYNRTARLLITELTASGADLPDEWSDKNSAISGDPVLAESFTDPLVGKFVLVRGGTYMMGCTSFKDQCFPNEKPEHLVVLDHYYMAETEVTQKQWRAVMGTDLANPGFRCDDCPVERVSWDDAIRFIQKLNTLSPVQYRLPSEAEWEYAARGGHLSRKNYNYSGGLDPGQVAWTEKNSGKSTHPVGKRLPNELGLYDMSGNVSEWCQDIYREYEGNPEVTTGGMADSRNHVYRGGSWNDNISNCRVSNRSSLPSDTRFNTLGFRLVAE